MYDSVEALLAQVEPVKLRDRIRKTFVREFSKELKEAVKHAEWLTARKLKQKREWDAENCVNQAKMIVDMEAEIAELKWQLAALLHPPAKTGEALH